MATVTDPIILDSTGQDIVTALNNLNTPRDTAAYTTSFASSDTDDASATSWTVVSPIAGGETHATLFGKLSQIAKNVRFLYKTLGNTDLSAIADGTVTGAIADINKGRYSEYQYTDSFNSSQFDVRMFKIGRLVLMRAQGMSSNPGFTSNAIYGGTKAINELSKVVTLTNGIMYAQSSNRPKQYFGSISRTNLGGGYTLALRTNQAGWDNGTTLAYFEFISSDDEPLNEA